MNQIAAASPDSKETLETLERLKAARAIYAENVRDEDDPVLKIFLRVDAEVNRLENKLNGFNRCKQFAQSPKQRH